MYGLVYMKTVARYPATIFFVSSGSVAISLVLFGFVRLPANLSVAMAAPSSRRRYG